MHLEPLHVQLGSLIRHSPPALGVGVGGGGGGGDGGVGVGLPPPKDRTPPFLQPSLFLCEGWLQIDCLTQIPLFRHAACRPLPGYL